jgi:PAS domain S-box-containing protein
MSRPTSRAAVVGADATGAITYVNPAAERMTGRSAQDLRGETLAALVDPVELAQRAAVVGTGPDVEALVAPLRGGAHLDRQDWHLRQPGGPSVPASVTLAATRNAEGAVSGFVAVVIDVTEFRLSEERLDDALAREHRVVEELRRLDEQRTDFAVTVSHELRTPVASVLGFTELLLDDGAGPLSPSQRSMLERVERNGQRLKLLVEDLLDLTVPARVPDGAARPRTSLQELVRQAVATQQPLIDAHDVEVTLVGSDAPDQVEGDPAQLSRAVAHVLSNAVQFSHDFATVRLVTAVAAGVATITVCDEGPGIPAHELDTVFDRFFRGSVSHARATQGAGLGLTLARAVVEAHGGSIEVASVEGEGTRVSLRLPLVG